MEGESRSATDYDCHCTEEFGMKFVGVDNAAVKLLGFVHCTELPTSPPASVIFT